MKAGPQRLRMRSPVPCFPTWASGRSDSTKTMPQSRKDDLFWFVASQADTRASAVEVAMEDEGNSQGSCGRVVEARDIGGRRERRLNIDDALRSERSSAEATLFCKPMSSCVMASGRLQAKATAPAAPAGDRPFARQFDC